MDGEKFKYIPKLLVESQSMRGSLSLNAYEKFKNN